MSQYDISRSINLKIGGMEIVIRRIGEGIKRLKRSDKELNSISKELFGELNLLIYAAISLSRVKDELIRIVLLDSFAIHARSLLDFLYAREYKIERYPTTVIAEDFFDKPEDWRTIRPIETQILKNVLNKVNTQIAHLKFERLLLEDREREIGFRQITKEITSVFKKFLDNVSESKLNKEDRDIVEENIAQGMNVLYATNT